jgi:hypothetical protein
MFPKPLSNAAPKIAIKRKRALVWPFATRTTLEQAISNLINKGTVEEPTHSPGRMAHSPLYRGQRERLPT